MLHSRMKSIIKSIHTMKKLLKIIGLSLSFGLIASSVFASTVPIVPAVFDTSLASPITSSDSSMTLSSGTLRDGTTLSGYACFTIDESTPILEYVCGTANGTSVTSMTRGLSPLSGTTTVAALQFAHRRGADVKISDFPIMGILSRFFQGADTIPVVLTYGSSLTIATSSNQIPTATFVNASANTASSSAFSLLTSSSQTINGIFTFVTAQRPTLTSDTDTANNTDLVTYGQLSRTAIAGGVNGNEATKGVYQLATAAQAAAGTRSGSTGAILALGSTIATSTSQTATTSIVVTNTLGKIDPTFLTNTTYTLSTANVTTSQIGDLTITNSCTGCTNSYIAAPNMVATTSVSANDALMALPSTGGTADNVATTTGTGTTILGFGVSGTSRIAQSFQKNDVGMINSVIVDLMKTGTPSDRVQVQLMKGDATSPNNTVLAMGEVAGSSLTTSMASTTINFNKTLALNEGTYYWIVFTRSSGTDDGSNNYSTYVSGASTWANGTANRSDSYGSSWSNDFTTKDIPVRPGFVGIGRLFGGIDNYEKHFIGFAIGAAATGTSFTLATHGTLTSFGSLTTGSNYFASTTPGGINITSIASGLNNPIGLAASSSALIIKP